MVDDDDVDDDASDEADVDVDAAEGRTGLGET